MSQELDTINAIFQANYRRGSAYKHMPAFENFDFDEVMKFMKLAYNQAIQDAIKNVELYMEEVKLDETSYTIDAYNTWYVDTDIWINKDSILKLKIK